MDTTRTEEAYALLKKGDRAGAAKALEEAARAFIGDLNKIDDMTSARKRARDDSRAIELKLNKEERCTPEELVKIMAVIVEHGGFMDETGYVTFPTSEARLRCIADPRITYTPFK
jgi:hypothetical protein